MLPNHLLAPLPRKAHGEAKLTYIVCHIYWSLHIIEELILVPSGNGSVGVLLIHYSANRSIK